jgi:hypothetical protein
MVEKSIHAPLGVEISYSCCKTTTVWKYPDGTVYLRVNDELCWLSVSNRGGQYSVTCYCDDQLLQNNILSIVDPKEVINDSNNAAKLFKLLKGAIECSAFQ